MELKQLVYQALVDAFGSEAVEWDNTALKVRARRLTLQADVVPAFAYRYYFNRDASGQGVWVAGHRIWPDRGAATENWPDQHYENGVTKNRATRQRFKQMVRALKRLENELRDQRLVQPTPSFLSECLVYNVPDEYFGHDAYLDDMRNVLSIIASATASPASCASWDEVSGMKRLFGPAQRWTCQQANTLAVASWHWMSL
jgi:hypothetical protein